MTTCLCSTVWEAVEAQHEPCFDRLCSAQHRTFGKIVTRLIRGGHLAFLQVLLRRGEGFKFPTKASQVAVKYGQLEILQALWYPTALDYDRTMLLAIRTNQPEMVEFIWKNPRGGSLSRLSFLEQAARGGHLTCYHCLISLGAMPTPTLQARLNRQMATRSQ